MTITKKERALPFFLTLLTVLLLSAFGGRSNARAAGWRFGDQLRGREKELYELLEDGYPELKDRKTSGITIRFPSLMTEKEVRNLHWFRVQWAFLLDHSDLFWIDSLTINYNLQQDSSAGSYGASWAVVYSVDKYAGIRGEIADAQKAIGKAVDAVKKKSGRYAKVKAAHDYVVKLVAYPKNLSPVYYYAVTGPLLRKYGHKGVCQAYARLFDIICKANGIPCVTLAGNNHAWNYVQMEDGKWYLVDTTWDDPDNGDKISYHYFLVGANTSVDGKVVKQTHNADSVKEIYRLENNAPLKYPALSETAYKKSSQTRKVSSVKIKSTATQVKAGKKLALKATVLPDKASNKKLKWSSSNTKYATVSSKGVVKAKRAGKGKTVKITAKATDGSGKKATIKIKIK